MWFQYATYVGPQNGSDSVQQVADGFRFGRYGTSARLVSFFQSIRLLVSENSFSRRKDDITFRAFVRFSR